MPGDAVEFRKGTDEPLAMSIASSKARSRPTCRCRLAIKLKTAKTPGLSIPESFVQRADEVLE